MTFSVVILSVSIVILSGAKDLALRMTFSVVILSVSIVILSGAKDLILRMTSQYT